MVSIEAYRIVIALSHYLKSMIINWNNSSRKGHLKKSNNKLWKSLNIHFLSGITITFPLITFSVLLISFNDGDFESNRELNYTIE